MNTHELESTLGDYNWAKAYCGFFPFSLDIYWCVSLMDLAVLADLEVQVSLIVQGLSVHYGLGYLHS